MHILVYLAISVNYLPSKKSISFWSFVAIFNTEFPASAPLIERPKSASIIYPNPVPETFFNTIFDLTETQNVRCSILDVNGKLIQHLLEKNCTKGKNQFSFNINPLSTGNYILMIKGDKGFLYSEKLIKE